MSTLNAVQTDENSKAAIAACRDFLAKVSALAGNDAVPLREAFFLSNPIKFARLLSERRDLSDEVRRQLLRLKVEMLPSTASDLTPLIENILARL